METEPSTVRFVVYGDPVPKERARTVTDVKPNGKKVTHSYTPENSSIHDEQIVEMTGRKFFSEKPRTEICISRLDHDE